MGGLTESQIRGIETTERVASIFSLIGCSFIFITFLASPRFGRPINRLIFYASWGNMLCNVGTLISQAGINAGQDSALCQIQGFLIQLLVSISKSINPSEANEHQVRASRCNVEYVHGHQRLLDGFQKLQHG